MVKFKWQSTRLGSLRGALPTWIAIACTQNKKRTILSLKKEPMLHILNNPLESQIWPLQKGNTANGFAMHLDRGRWLFQELSLKLALLLFFITLFLFCVWCRNSMGHHNIRSKTWVGHHSLQWLLSPIFQKKICIGLTRTDHDDLLYWYMWQYCDIILKLIPILIVINLVKIQQLSELHWIGCKYFE